MRSYAASLPRWLGAASLLVLSTAAIDAGAAQVKGTVEAPPAVSLERAVGYMQTRVASRSQIVAQQKADVALFLMVKTSLPLPPPAETEPFKVAISGLRFVPSMAACVVDGKVAFTNEDRSPVTLIVEQQAFATIAPGETKTYDCATGEPKMRRLRVKEWPHIRGALFVGEVGLVAPIGANGAFAIPAVPQGSFELQVIGENGPLATKAVEMGKTDVDVGRLHAGGAKAAEDAPTLEPLPKTPVKVPSPKPRPVKPPVQTSEGGENGTEGAEP